jgi:hypothetical protein
VKFELCPIANVFNGFSATILQVPRQFNLAQTAYLTQAIPGTIVQNLKFKFYEFLDGYI